MHIKKEHYSNFCTFEIASLVDFPGHFTVLNLTAIEKFKGNKNVIVIRDFCTLGSMPTLRIKS